MHGLRRSCEISVQFESAVNQWRVHFSLTDPATSQILASYHDEWPLENVTPQDLSIMNSPEGCAPTSLLIILGFG